ncbi:MAG: ATP-binding protein, partial [Candidatus Helarchaeota archaeon]|nr:ATP-binding protein [Candidatus Helarchaeota archaeon]
MDKKEQPPVDEKGQPLQAESPKMTDDEVEMYRDILKEGTPFDRFVSRGDVRDSIDIKAPREEAERAVRRALRSTIADGTARLLPIVGVAGTGKTHFYWALKDLEQKEDKDWVCVYVPSPPTPVRTLLHIYTCLADEIGNLIETVSNRVIETYGKKGFFGISMKDVINNAVRFYPGVGVDVIRALVIYGMAKEQSLKHAAERWLLGESFTEEELDKLKLNSVLESDDVCLATLKIYSQNLKKVIILYFDELEIPFRTFGPEAEMHLLETIKRIYNEIPNVVIITACLEEVWLRVMNEIADPAIKSRMEREVQLKPFRVEDVEAFYISAMRHFWENEKNVPLPSDPLFPLNQTIFEDIHKKSKGNPRESIKIIRDYMDMVLFGEGLPKPMAPEIQPALKAEANPSTGAKSSEVQAPVKASVQLTIGEEEYVIDVNPASVAGAALDSITTISRELNKPLEIKLDYEFPGKDKKAKKIAGYVEEKETHLKCGIEVPSIKTFDRSGGVAAFYAASRIMEAVHSNSINKAILIVPTGTSGKKYTSLLESAGDKLIVVELTQEDAEALVRSAKTAPCSKGRQIAHVVFPSLSLEAPAVPAGQQAPPAA